MKPQKNLTPQAPSPSLDESVGASPVKPMFFLVKLIVTLVLILAISELVKRTGFWGSLVAALPTVSVLSIVWIYLETGDTAKISSFSSEVLWLVLPSLLFFIFLPLCLQKWDLNFWLSLGIASLATMVGYAGVIWLLPK